MTAVRYSWSPAREKRRHYLRADDIEVLLSRLPEAVWERLRTVHFNDRSRGGRSLGYVNMGHREIAICALPSGVSLTKFLAHPGSTLNRLRRSPHEYGALRGRQWPEIAVRRFLLYNTFLHELGHLQIIDAKASRLQRKFASETRAQEFADYWRKRLWDQPFEHPDPIHHRASADELAALVETETLARIKPIASACQTDSVLTPSE
jgi:hypothetical protein